LVKEVSYEFSTDINKKVIEIGIETGSPNIIKRYNGWKTKTF